MDRALEDIKTSDNNRQYVKVIKVSTALNCKWIAVENILAFDLLAETLSISHILKVTWFDFAHVNDGTAPENTQVRRVYMWILQHLNDSLGREVIYRLTSPHCFHLFFFVFFAENAFPSCDCGWRRIFEGLRHFQLWGEFTEEQTVGYW